MRQVNGHAIGVVGHEGTALAALLPPRRQHELLHDELRPAVEQVGKRHAALRSFEDIILVDPNPGQLPAQPRHLVAAPCQVLLCGKQIAPCFQPLFT